MIPSVQKRLFKEVEGTVSMEDIEKALEESGLHVDLNLTLTKIENGLLNVGFGKGLIELCCLVQEKGSLNRAAREMGLSYSKAWHLVRNAENVLGVELLRCKGAKGSEVTLEAKELIASYNDIQQNLKCGMERSVFEMIERIHKRSNRVVV